MAKPSEPNVTNDEVLNWLGDGPATTAQAPMSKQPTATTLPASTVVPHSPSPATTHFTYQMVQIPPTIEVAGQASNDGLAAGYLQSIVNNYARQGWEFYRVDSIGVYNPPGCLLALLGQSGTYLQYYVVTFRRPA